MPMAPADIGYNGQNVRPVIQAAMTKIDNLMLDPVYVSSNNHAARTPSQLAAAITVVGTSKIYAGSDRAKIYKRSNAGVAMEDTLPTLTLGDAGWTLDVQNVDSTASITFTAPSGNFPNATDTYVLPAESAQRFEWTGTDWKFDPNLDFRFKFEGQLNGVEITTIQDGWTASGWTTAVCENVFTPAANDSPDNPKWSLRITYTAP